MLKVFLVEDEYAMRERMKKNIMWEDHGFTLVGEAGDGELAYPMIQELQPDILITDIKMPFMDGLQLIELVKEQLPQIKVLILSGYDEFDYAKEAIRLGVTDYLLKPVTSKKILQSLNKVAALIEKEQQQLINQKRAQLETNEKKQLQKKQFFNSLISGRENIPSLIEKAKELNINLNAIAYQIVRLKITALGKGSVSDEEILRQALNNYFNLQKTPLIFERDVNDYTILLKGSTQQLNHSQQQLITQLTEIFNNYTAIPYYIGIGERVSRISEIPHAFETASQAIAYRYLLNDTHVLHYDELKPQLMLRENEDIDLHKLEHPQLNKKQLQNFLYNGHLQEIDTFIELYFQEIKSSLNSYIFRHYLIVDLYLSLTAFCHELKASPQQITAIFEQKQNINLLLHDEVALKRLIHTWLSDCLNLRVQENELGYRPLIAQVKCYLQDNYNKEGLSLNQVAEHVNMSGSHLSALFSQETGQTFISYLTEIRMMKAKELLRTTTKKTLEIGYEVGYKDAHYFSSLFKKTQHCTPKQYRSQKHDVD